MLGPGPDSVVLLKGAGCSELQSHDNISSGSYRVVAPQSQRPSQPSQCFVKGYKKLVSAM